MERRALDGQLIKQEIAEMSGTVQAGKAAGPDDIPSDSYRKFQSKLLSPLLEVFWTSFMNGLLPTSKRVARIMLLPKPGKPKYKISLLNSDTKILCEALARRRKVCFLRWWEKTKMDFFKVDRVFTMSDMYSIFYTARREQRTSTPTWIDLDCFVMSSFPLRLYLYLANHTVNT